VWCCLKAFGEKNTPKFAFTMILKKKAIGKVLFPFQKEDF
jgi:hypothetical protein